MTTPKQLEDAVFFTALQVEDAALRKEFLDHACMDDDGLRKVVEDLLASQVGAEEMMDRGYTAIALSTDEILEIPPDLMDSDSEQVDRRIGETIEHYTLTGILGRGGCGDVYLAEQESPVRRTVALKVIKLGMDSRNVIARFDAERETLALMDHPNIARVLDAGTTDSGRPYFVLELVRGTRITEFCDTEQCGIRQRIELFILVCRAIQHAHQKGIIHRDIKPSNVLVARHDGVPVPKVIDFGIAKVFVGEIPEKPGASGKEQFLGTPAYMSPEQAAFCGMDVDTRSDVYSLGILLYELLTGKTPFDAAELARAGSEGMGSILREREALSPSSMLASMTPAELESMAVLRKTEAAHLRSRVKGDLDWITMRALAKDRSRRYDSANALAMDLQRFLNNEPVIARPHSRFYLLSKLVRRNIIVFAAGSAVALVLVAGTVVSTWQSIKARQAERHQAELRVVAELALANEAVLRRDAEGREKLTEAVVFLKQGDFDSAVKSLDEMEERPKSPSFDGVTALRSVGEWLAARGRWEEATERFMWLFDIDKLDPWGPVTLDCQACGVLLAESGDAAAYRRFCLEVIEIPAASANGDAAGRILKSCLLLPPDAELVQRLQPLGIVTEKWFAATGHSQGVSWAAIPPSLWRYRNGDYEGVISVLAIPLSRPSPNVAVTPTLRVIHAMALFRTGDEEGARRELASAREAVEQRYAQANGVIEGSQDAWYDWLFVRILLREARDLVGDPS